VNFNATDSIDNFVHTTFNIDINILDVCDGWKYRFESLPDHMICPTTLARVFVVKSKWLMTRLIFHLPRTVSNQATFTVTTFPNENSLAPFSGTTHKHGKGGAVFGDFPYPPACPNASGHPVAVEVVVSPSQRIADLRGCLSAPRSNR